MNVDSLGNIFQGCLSDFDKKGTKFLIRNKKTFIELKKYVEME